MSETSIHIRTTIWHQLHIYSKWNRNRISHKTRFITGYHVSYRHVHQKDRATKLLLEVNKI
jgi:hypothetical protein